MQVRIADELSRADLTTQIQKAILSAIEFYKDDRFWFNEGEVTLNTVANLGNQPMPTSPTGVGEIDIVTVTAFSDRYEVFLTSYDWIRENQDQTTFVGVPEKYAIFEEDIWYSPIPDGVYPIIFSGLIYFATMTTGSDSNVWTNEAEELIRTRAKWDLFSNVIRNDKEAAKMLGNINDIIMPKLKQKHVQKVSSNRLKPIKF